MSWASWVLTRQNSLAHSLIHVLASPSSWHCNSVLNIMFRLNPHISTPCSPLYFNFALTHICQLGPHLHISISFSLLRFNFPLTLTFQLCAHPYILILPSPLHFNFVLTLTFQLHPHILTSFSPCIQISPSSSYFNFVLTLTFQLRAHPDNSTSCSPIHFYFALTRIFQLCTHPHISTSPSSSYFNFAHTLTAMFNLYLILTPWGYMIVKFAIMSFNIYEEFASTKPSGAQCLFRFLHNSTSCQPISHKINV